MAGPSQNSVDLDALLDLTEYNTVSSYHSPSLSPSASSKPTFASPITPAIATPSIPSSHNQTLSGPSHNYDLYRQQTGFVPGAIANTMAVNQNSNTGYQEYSNVDYLSTFSPENGIFDFNTPPSQHTIGASDMEMEFESSADAQQFFPTVDPSNIEQTSAGLPSPPVVPTQTSNVGRLWPGAHSQAALAKSQAQQRQQQQMIQQQQQQAPRQAAPQKSRKASQPTDPIVEQKITQLLNSMRAKPASPESQSPSNHGGLSRSKKEEEEMDEDERLLASEEGKKLSSKERRQLRNKVSARAFRSRRKEYITQLEAEIANKVNENGDLRAHNRALAEENKRLTDLTRMLLSSSSFSSFLDTISQNPATIPQTAPIKVEPQQQEEQRQIAKDVNPYNGLQSQQIGMAMIPEQHVDFSMLAIDNSAYNFQPQVFMVDTPDVPASIDTSLLSGKASNFVEQAFESDNEKVELPAIERPSELVAATEPVEAESEVVDDEFENDPEFALFHSEVTSTTERTEIDTDSFTDIDIFGGIESEKVLSRFELADATEEETAAALAMARVQRISSHLESLVSRLEMLTVDL
jgi:hypothetical protein